MAQSPPLTYPKDFTPFATNQSPDLPFESRAAVVIGEEVNLLVFNVNLINIKTGEKKRLNRYYGIPYLKDIQGVDLFDVNLPDVILHLQKGDKIYIGQTIKEVYYGDYYNVRTIKFIDDLWYFVEVIGAIAPEDINKFKPINSSSGPFGPNDPDMSLELHYNPKFNNARFEEQVKYEKGRKKRYNYHNKEKELSANLRLPNRIKTRKTFGGKKRKSRQMRKPRHHHKN